MRYSIIVPVFNRPDEVDELLESLSSQTLKDFEVVIVEDGSQIPCKDVCDKYANILDLHYYFKENSGPGQSRNYGVERAQGEYVIILDSDASFSDIQKAISYAMTSFFTTGGIRGGKKQLDKKFYPRSFNLGVRREVYQQLGGFTTERFSKMSLYGEDIDFSLRIYKNGYSCRLFPEAWLWHKRRTDFRKFWRQVYNSGYARINLWRKYPEALKPVHALPAVFTIGVAGLLLLSVFSVLAFIPLILYSVLIFIDSTIRNKSVMVGLKSIPAAFIQLIGYGVGFLESLFTKKHG